MAQNSISHPNTHPKSATSEHNQALRIHFVLETYVVLQNHCGVPETATQGSHGHENPGKVIESYSRIFQAWKKKHEIQ